MPNDTRWVKDPASRLDYTWAWAPRSNDKRPWLGDLELITGASITSTPAGLTVDQVAPTVDGKNVVAWVAGGTLGVTYTLRCTITTNQGRTDTRSKTLVIENR